MNWRTILIGGVSVLLGVGGSVASIHATRAEMPDSNPSVEARRQAIVPVAKSAYEKLKQSRESDGNRTVSDEALSASSLEWFRAEVARVKSKEQAVKVALEYLERERVAVGKDAT